MERKSKYLPNEEIIEEIGATGTVVYSDSTVSVAAVRYKVVREEDVRLQGLLDGISWEAYKLANNEKTKLEVDEDFVSMVANATGIPSKNVSFVAFEEVQFIDEMTEPVVVKRYRTDCLNHYYSCTSGIRGNHEPENQERSRGRGRTCSGGFAAVQCRRIQRHRDRAEVRKLEN